jgi:hypothetical protein
MLWVAVMVSTVFSDERVEPFAVAGQEPTSFIWMKSADQTLRSGSDH